jgi:hypothetical protein
MIVRSRRGREFKASPSVALQKSPPARDTFYVVKQCCPASMPETVTVVHQVPKNWHRSTIQIKRSILRKRRFVNYGRSAHWLNLSIRPMVWLAPAETQRGNLEVLVFSLL